eukprot:TRINITY_DN4283_c0_g2_i3.p1 TRINITY_DN4283_c0_g2~~TRINITY_DN4283_c0_g2_i3.p1  ORF type:complete len:146 (-),score=26.11 TRINITY_DN4283_c0_g2_i3:64-462(-)
MSTFGGCTVHVDSDGIARVLLNSSSVSAGDTGVLTVADVGTEGDTQFADEKSRMLVAHLEGHCKPCVYFVRKGGCCLKGDDCAFCHFCTPEDYIRKRKAAYSKLKEEAKANGTWKDRKYNKRAKAKNRVGTD